MTDTIPPELLSVTGLVDALADPALRIVDARFKMPGVLPTAEADYLSGHIPGAVFFDIDAVAADDTSLPHMLPTAEAFGSAVGALGIGEADWVVLYDATGLAGAARAWWTFRVFGHRRLSILDGGLRSWSHAGGAIEAGSNALPAVPYHGQFDPALVRSGDQLLENLEQRREQVLDARSAGRFAGTDPEPWPGRRQGRIPGSFNLDHTRLIDPATGCMLPPDDLRAMFQSSGIDLDQPVVTSCGSGVTACVLAFALRRLGHDAAVFDGSWAEWGLPGRYPIETGAIETGPKKSPNR